MGWPAATLRRSNRRSRGRMGEITLLLMMYSSKSRNTSVTAVTDTNVAVLLQTIGAAKSNLANRSNKTSETQKRRICEKSFWWVAVQVFKSFQMCLCRNIAGIQTSSTGQSTDRMVPNVSWTPAKETWRCETDQSTTGCWTCAVGLLLMGQERPLADAVIGIHTSKYAWKYEGGDKCTWQHRRL